MADRQSYYDILGVSKDATEDEIKKAYKKLALKWHPDKNPDNVEEAEDKFRLIGESYSILKDADKRRAYDMCGKEGVKNGGGFSTGTFTGAEDLFANFFGTANVFEAFDKFFQSDPFARDFLGDTRGGMFSDSGFSFGGGIGGGFGGGFDDGFGGSSSFSSISSTDGFGGGRGGVSFTSTSMSTKTVNGRTVTTKKTMKNGVETVIVIENGKEISRQVGGVEQLTDGRDGGYNSKRIKN